MSTETNLASSSVKKYTRAINTISKEMLSLKVINNKLTNMNKAELNQVIKVITLNNYFINKNTTGNNMYSRALIYFVQFNDERNSGTI